MNNHPVLSIKIDFHGDDEVDYGSTLSSQKCCYYR